ncbi:DGQHR domain-containing protein DpdB [Pseudogulbenkiania sp. MAI-1]|uniref:DGQHR domain-containing protein DpdB n=1 Tax=Pseudogulbenkiania sp. MAI-1 TaxID=990370 RepID=UPI000A009728|nr:DGQHR domain-containing protein DpdB [Pseudogulbenkiania sp. MAI-1]
MNIQPTEIKVSAIAFQQGDVQLYSFVVEGRALTRIADLSRLKRDDDGGLEGFQRPEIQQHVKQITDYLNEGSGLFPNAIILALSPDVKFSCPRGPARTGVPANSRPGYLSLPARAEGERVAWIVDGQQRSLALARSNKGDLLVPVIAFVANSLELQRQQFILVNRAKPLPQRLVNELLPETDDTFLPRDLAANKIPAQLCAALHENSRSPFFGRISRPSGKPARVDTFTDSAIIVMIRERINNPIGALAHLKGYQSRCSDIDMMYRVLDAYWSAVAETFPDAWVLPPERSRLTHSAGIRAMGSLLDRMASRVDLKRKDLKVSFKSELAPLAERCAWTSGTWPYTNLPWNAIEVTPRGINELTRTLNSMYMETVTA